MKPRAPIPMDPAAAVLHYAQEIFEGLKAYRHDDGSVWAFRPEANGARLEMTALVDGYYAEVQAMGGNRWDTSSLAARLDKPAG